MGVALELLVAAGISTGFFVVFLLNLALVFPSGISLEALTAAVPERSRVESLARTQPVAKTSSLAVNPLAALEILRAGVRSKLADAIVWSPAVQRQHLMDRDGVQTDREGRARLDFGAGGELILEPNSLIILSAGARAADGRPKPAGVLVLDGEIWGRLAQSASPPPSITLGSAVFEAVQGPLAEVTEFRVQVRKEGGSSVSVLKGSLKLGSSAGPVSLRPGEFAVVSPTGIVASPKLLPPTPRPVRPSGNTSFRYSRMPPQIEFRWADIPRATRYRLVVVQEGPERTVVVDERVAWPSLTIGRLGDGRYQWRVSAWFDNVEGFPSAWSPVAVVHEGREKSTAPDAPREPRVRRAAAPAPVTQAPGPGRTGGSR